MKKITLLLLSIWVVLFVVQPAYAGFITPSKQITTSGPSPKVHPKMDKMVEKVEKTVQKLSEKKGFFGKILKKHGSISNRWLIPMIVFLIASIVLGVVPIAGFGWLSYIAWVLFVVFFILWLLALLDVM